MSENEDLLQKAGKHFNKKSFGAFGPTEKDKDIIIYLQSLVDGDDERKSKIAEAFLIILGRAQAEIGTDPTDFNAWFKAKQEAHKLIVQAKGEDLDPETLN